VTPHCEYYINMAEFDQRQSRTPLLIASATIAGEGSPWQLTSIIPLLGLPIPFTHLQRHFFAETGARLVDRHGRNPGGAVQITGDYQYRGPEGFARLKCRLCFPRGGRAESINPNPAGTLGRTRRFGAVSRRCRLSPLKPTSSQSRSLARVGTICPRSYDDPILLMRKNSPCFETNRFKCGSDTIFSKIGLNLRST
jgi:hypothetical protein